MPKKGESVSEATRRQLRRAQTKYRTAYCGEIIEYFIAPRSEKGWKREIDVSGMVDGQFIDGKMPVYIPTLTGFCDYIGISLHTLYNWADTYEEFGDAYEEALQIKKDLIDSYALMGQINPNFAKYMLESWHPRERKKPKEPADSIGEGAEPSQSTQGADERSRSINVSISVNMPEEMREEGEKA